MYYNTRHMIYPNNDVYDEIAKRIKNYSVIALGDGKGMMNIAENLVASHDCINGIVTSSKAMKNYFNNNRFSILDPNEVSIVDLYIDTAEEVTKDFVINKKGDIKFTRAKIMAYQAREFICVVEKSNYIKEFNNTTMLVEVLPYARSLAARKAKSLNANVIAKWHKDVITENGNYILEIHNLDLHEPWEIEDALEAIPGVVSSSIFSSVTPDILIISGKTTAHSITKDDAYSLSELN